MRVWLRSAVCAVAVTLAAADATVEATKGVGRAVKGLIEIPGTLFQKTEP